MSHGKQPTFPAGMVNGYRIEHRFQVEGKEKVFATLDDAFEYARRLEPKPASPMPPTHLAS